MASISVLEELNNLENSLRKQTNDNILLKHGLTEQIEEFQKPVVEKLGEIKEGQTRQTAIEFNKLPIENKFQEALGFPIQASLVQNLPKSIQPIILSEKGAATLSRDQRAAVSV